MANITLEPGGQVELSGAPHRTLTALAEEMQANRRALLDLSADKDHVWIAAGLTPITPIAQIPWVPKGRYGIMKRYLPQRGDLAAYMMKGTCSVQANYDFASESDCARKVRLSSGLAPLTTALFANSPLLENKPTGFKSYRGHIWTRTDPDRTGFPPGLRNDCFGLTSIHFRVSLHDVLILYQSFAHEITSSRQNPSVYRMDAIVVEPS